MSVSKSEKNIESKTKKYLLVPPDGGFGYVTAIGMIFFFITVFAPFSCLGLIFGPYLSQFGDETRSLTTLNSTFNSVYHFTGILANPLLRKWSKRKVGLLGAAFICSANIASIFAKTPEELIISFGVFQGIGNGFILSATLTTFDEYFTKKKNILMNICQLVTVCSSIVYPKMFKFLMEEFGYRGTVAIYSAITVNTIFTALSLHPVEWYMKKVFIKNDTNEEKNECGHEIDQLTEYGQTDIGNSLTKDVDDVNYKPIPRLSIVSFASAAAVSETGNKSNDSFWKSIIKSIDISLLKDPFYVNLVVGCSLALIAENNFLAILPNYMKNSGYDQEQVTNAMSVYFVADLICRIIFVIGLAFFSVSNRILLFGGVVAVILARIVFVFSPSFIWILMSCGMLGAFRLFLHVPIVLSIAEEYPKQFSSAYTLYMVICGFVASAIGPIMNAVKYFTQSDQMMMHVLTLQLLIVVVTWVFEFGYKRAKGTIKTSEPIYLGVSQ